MSARLGVAALFVLAAAVAAFVAAGRDAAPRAAAGSGAATATAAVQRRDLVDRESVSGTLGYAGRGAVTAGVSGTLTGLRREGTVVRRGQWLYEVDGDRTGWLLYGRRPAWRDLQPGMSGGADVRQLEANLEALGHEPGAVDGEWTWETTAAVRRFQAARGLDEDGGFARGEIVFRAGALRLGEAKAALGQAVQPGAALFEASSTRRLVDVDLDADRQDLARRGAEVTVGLPDGRTARGRIRRVGTVATVKGDREQPTIAVTVTLRGRAARRGGFDQAPVDVGFERERAKGALTVPVGALVARPGGGYGVEVAEEAGRRMVAVQPGLTADGHVAVTGDLRPGQRVVVPA